MEPNFLTINSNILNSSVTPINLTYNSSISSNIEKSQDSLATVIPMTILYTLIFITGVIGNICTCIVICRNKYMRTATNYYLFSLAISDLLLLNLGLPQEIYMLWQKSPYTFSEFFCVMRGLTSETSSNASVLTITAFTIERYLAICHPLRAHTMSRLSRVIKLIIVIWIFAALGATPLAFQFGIKYEYVNGKPDPNTAECTVISSIDHSFEISSIVFFAVPCVVISVLYLFIGRQLRRSNTLNCHSIEPSLSDYRPQHSKNYSNNVHSKNQINLLRSAPFYSKFKTHANEERRLSIKGSSVSSRRAVIRMLIAVVAAFFICWAPFHAQRLMATYVDNPTLAEIMIFNLLTHISGITYYISAVINPILYSIMSLKFRQAFKETLGHCFRSSSDQRLGKFSSLSISRSRFNSTIRSSKEDEHADLNKDSLNGLEGTNSNNNIQSSSK